MTQQTGALTDLMENTVYFQYQHDSTQLPLTPISGEQTMSCAVHGH